MDSLFVLAKETEQGDLQAWLDAEPQVGELDDYMNVIVREDMNKIIVIYGNDSIPNPFWNGLLITQEMEEGKASADGDEPTVLEVLECYTGASPPHSELSTTRVVSDSESYNGLTDETN